MKRAKLWIVAALVVILVACGGDSNQEEYNNGWYTGYENGNDNERGEAALLPFPIPEGDRVHETPPTTSNIWTPPLATDGPLELEIDRSAVVAAGGSRSFAIDANGVLWAWGSNSNGRLGDGTTENRYEPVQIIENAAVITTGTHTSQAVLENGDLMSWGMNGNNIQGNTLQFPNGGVGDGTFMDRHEPIRIMQNMVSASGAAAFSTGLRDNGDVYFWGNFPMSTGLRQNISTVQTIVVYGNFDSPTSTLYGTTQVFAGTNAIMAISHEGHLYGWGSGLRNTLGSTAGFADSFFMFVTRIVDDVSMAAMGSEHYLVLTQEGRLYGWGGNRFGQVGDGTTASSYAPIFIMDDVIYIAAGHQHSLAITSGGTLYAWGNNQFGRLGTGDTNLRNTPTAIMQDVNTASAGTTHSVAITNNGQLWAWGDNRSGQLGDGTTTSQHSPIMIMENMRLAQ